MMKRSNGLLLLMAGLLFGAGIGAAILVWVPGIADRQAAPPPWVGLPAGDFSVASLSNGRIQLSDYTGEPVVLNFWATWCPPCKEEMPLFDQYAQKLGGKVHFIAMNVEDDEKVVQEYIDQSRINLPVGLDREGKIADLYYVNSFPVTFFIDGQGVIRAQHIGQLDEALLEKYLATIGVSK